MSIDIECVCCHESVPDDGMFVTCSVCDYAYHLGKCSGVSGSTYRSKGERFKTSWKCATCETAKKKSGQHCDEPNIAKQLNELNDKVTQLLPLVAKVDALSELMRKVTDIETSVEHLSEQYDSVLVNLERNTKDIATLKNKVAGIESSTSPAVRQVQVQLNDIEQYSRRQNLEIHGLAHELNENLLQKLNDLASKLELPELLERDLEGLHRLPAPANKVPIVVARFASYSVKKKWMDARRSLNNKAKGKRFFDNLTAENRRLLWQARTKATAMGYRFAWQREGHVFVRKAEGDKALRIQSESDLDRIE